MAILASSLRFPILCLMACCILLSSCATTQEGQQQLGALGGAALGALMGGLIGGDAQSALIGAAAGGLIGWSAVAIHQYHTAQIRTAKDDQTMYGMTKAGNAPMVKIRRATVVPERVKPGQQVEFTTDYSVYLPKKMREATVEEQWVLKKDGKDLQKFPPQPTQRAAGGYETNGAISIPKNTSAGTYVVEHTVQSGTSYDTVQTVFYVGS